MTLDIALDELAIELRYAAHDSKDPALAAILTGLAIFLETIVEM